MRRSGPGIAARFSLLAAALVAVSTALWGGWVWSREQARERQHTIQQARLLVSTMSIPIITALLYEEMGIVEEGGLLDNFVEEIMAQEALAPVYAMVLDPDGRVLAHNVLPEYGKLYADPLTLRALDARGFLLQETQAEGRPVWDLAYPLAIHGKRWGVLRVGVSLAPLEARLRSLSVRIAGFAGLFLAGGLLLFSALGRGMARPLRELVARMEQVGAGLPPPAPASPRTDEIGDLERSFTRMVERLRRTEADRDKATRKLLENERLVAAGQIVAGVAHEVNNPLAAIEGALFHIEKRSDDSLAPYLRILRQGVDRVSGVVAQLLDLSRSAELDRRAFPLAELIRDAALFAKMAVKQRGVRLQVDPEVPEEALVADRTRLQQALLNLFLNAADAAPEGGTVRFSCRVAEGRVRFQVEDDGPGVPPEHRERIFEPFFTTKPAGQGSGMGLAISRRIAEVHGGTLELDSGALGACFVLTVPLVPADEEPIETVR
ncbi:MAG: ATP-binding protein [Deferrisomatales bacterium]